MTASPTATRTAGFLQRYAGYCCTGITSEHVFVFAYGTGANGKSTFINTIAGSSATMPRSPTCRPSSPAIPNGTRPTSPSCGARLVVAQETEKGRRWDETKIKVLTGGDKITARFMRQDFFDFVPKFKLFICGNHKPRLSSVDEAIRRRLLLVPFTVQIPLAERDKDCGEAQGRMAGHPALVDGRLSGVAAHRLGAARDRARRHRRLLQRPGHRQQWLDDCTEDGGAFAFTRTSELFASWKSWCESRNFKPGSVKALSEALVTGALRKSVIATASRASVTSL